VQTTENLKSARRVFPAAE